MLIKSFDDLKVNILKQSLDTYLELSTKEKIIFLNQNGISLEKQYLAIYVANKHSGKINEIKNPFTGDSFLIEFDSKVQLKDGERILVTIKIGRKRNTVATPTNIFALHFIKSLESKTHYNEIGGMPVQTIKKNRAEIEKMRLEQKEHSHQLSLKKAKEREQQAQKLHKKIQKWKEPMNEEELNELKGLHFIDEYQCHYIQPYFPKRCWDNIDIFKYEISKFILKYKDLDKEIHEIYTQKLLQAIIEIAIKYELSKREIVLVPVPSSESRKLNAVSKSIQQIVSRVIIGYTFVDGTGTLVRKENISTSHLASSIQERPSFEDQLKTIRYNDKKLKCDSVVILIDDIITTGTTMKACEQILIRNGVKEVKKLVIGRTI